MSCSYHKIVAASDSFVQSFRGSTQAHKRTLRIEVIDWKYTGEQRDSPNKDSYILTEPSYAVHA